MECKNGDDSMGDCVASWAADGGVGGLAWKTDVSAHFIASKWLRKTMHEQNVHPKERKKTVNETETSKLRMSELCFICSVCFIGVYFLVRFLNCSKLERKKKTYRERRVQRAMWWNQLSSKTSAGNLVQSIQDHHAAVLITVAAKSRAQHPTVNEIIDSNRLD